MLINSQGCRFITQKLMTKELALSWVHHTFSEISLALTPGNAESKILALYTPIGMSIASFGLASYPGRSSQEWSETLSMRLPFSLVPRPCTPWWSLGMRLATFGLAINHSHILYLGMMCLATIKYLDMYLACPEFKLQVGMRTFKTFIKCQPGVFAKVQYLYSRRSFQQAQSSVTIFQLRIQCSGSYIHLNFSHTNVH